MHACGGAGPDSAPFCYAFGVHSCWSTPLCHPRWGGFKVTDTNGGPGGKAVPGFLQMVPELGRRGAHGHLETQVAVDKLHSNARLSLFGHPGTEGRASPAQLASRAASEALCVITVQTSAIMSGGSSGLTEGPALHHQA